MGTELWRPAEDWAKLGVEIWDEFFQRGISAAVPDEPGAPSSYVLQPIDGQLTYLRRGPNVRTEDSQAVQEADVQLDKVSLKMSSASWLHYHHT